MPLHRRLSIALIAAAVLAGCAESRPQTAAYDPYTHLRPKPGTTIILRFVPATQIAAEARAGRISNPEGLAYANPMQCTAILPAGKTIRELEYYVNHEVAHVLGANHDEREVWQDPRIHRPWWAGLNFGCSAEGL